MRAMRTAVLLLVLAAAAAAEGFETELSPVAFLVGEFQGTGRHAGGEYEETFTGEWTLGKTIVVVQSRSTMGARTVYEDLRVVSWDSAARKIRMRQFGMGDVATYEVKQAGEKVVLDEVIHEGGARGPWRYTYTPRPGGGFDYVVEARGADGSYARYAGGTLLPKPPDPSRQGELAYAQWRTSVPRAEGAAMPAVVHFPQGDGPFPVLVFSPGGGAETPAGYDTFGKWFASWGFVTVVCAFADATAEERAPKFAEVAAWLKEQNGDDGCPLKGKLDVGRLVAAGHSRGGHAAVLASRADPRFTACLALAPAGPDGAPGERQPATLLVVGDRDDLQGASASLFGKLGGPRVLVTVAGMDHMFNPGPAYRHVLARATAFLKARVAGDRAFEPVLTGEGEGVTVRTEP